VSFDTVSDYYNVKLLYEERIRWEAIEKGVKCFNLILPGKDTQELNGIF
jgi:hypothetical protein